MSCHDLTIPNLLILRAVAAKGERTWSSVASSGLKIWQNPEQNRDHARSSWARPGGWGVAPGSWFAAGTRGPGASATGTFLSISTKFSTNGFFSGGGIAKSQEFQKSIEMNGSRFPYK